MTSEPVPYSTLPQLSHSDLEDSYVLEVQTDEHSVHFRMDLVLLPEHPAYHEPLSGEQYCFKKGCISIENATSVRWYRRTMRQFVDAAGEIDYGSIDSWQILGDQIHIEGDWGDVEVTGGTVSVFLEP